MRTTRCGAVQDCVPTPLRVREIERAIAVAAGGRHTCAIDASRDLHCWGSNDYGESGTTAAASPVPARVTGGVLDIVAGGTLGDELTCALRDDGAVSCFGRGRYGQLGSGSRDSSTRWPASRLTRSGSGRASVSVPTRSRCGGSPSIGVPSSPT